MVHRTLKKGDWEIEDDGRILSVRTTRHFHQYYQVQQGNIMVTESLKERGQFSQ